MKISTTKYSVTADVPQSVTLLFISDLHGCDNDPIFETLKNVPHDAVLVGGDIVHDEKNYKRGLEFLNYCGKNESCFVALGNHESCFPGEIRREITDRGATLLDNSFVGFRGINIGGLTSGEFYMPSRTPYTGWLDHFARIDGFKLLLCHRPEYYDRYIRGLPIDLTISGHAHGGQWRIFNKGLYAPGQGIFPKYTSGMHDGRFIISRGLGNPHLTPRINNRPEILVIDIISKRAKKEEKL